VPARDLEPPAETGDAFEAGEMDGFAQYLDSVADELARLRETRAELLASVVPTISIAESVFAPGLYRWWLRRRTYTEFVLRASPMTTSAFSPSQSSHSAMRPTRVRASSRVITVTHASVGLRHSPGAS
jgi:hypothetical protein